jgi:putative phosphoesterase
MTICPCPDTGDFTVKIGILSDTHNFQKNTEAALAVLRARGINTVIHCGDITSPEIVHLFAGWDVTFVLGNMDSSHTGLIDATRRIGAPPPKRSQEIEVAGKWIAACHGHDHSLLFRLMISGKYAYVCHGHTHKRRDEYRSDYNVRLINPGALGGSQSQTRSIGILDVRADRVEFVEFPASF